MGIISNFHTDSVIVEEPIPQAAQILGATNIFTKFPHGLNKTSWELWYNEGFTTDGAMVSIGTDRSAFYASDGGFRIQLIAVWPDRSRWNYNIAFPECNFSGADDEVIEAIWKDSSTGYSVGWKVNEDATKMDFTFNVPGKVTGTFNLSLLPGDRGLDTSAFLDPHVCYMRPIGRAAAVSNLEFQFENDDKPRPLIFKDGKGGSDRFWGCLPWQGLMSQSYFLRAFVGPYTIHVLRLLSTEATGQTPMTTARLYRDNKLICIAQKSAKPDEERVDQDSLVLQKVYAEDKKDLIYGEFNDENVGYTVKFLEAGENGRRWNFKVVHERKTWTIPTSKPGPGATGNDGFVEIVSGGEGNENFEGIGNAGQIGLQPPPK